MTLAGDHGMVAAVLNAFEVDCCWARRRLRSPRSGEPGAKAGAPSPPRSRCRARHDQPRDQLPDPAVMRVVVLRRVPPSRSRWRAITLSICIDRGSPKYRLRGSTPDAGPATVRSWRAARRARAVRWLAWSASSTSVNSGSRWRSKIAAFTASSSRASVASSRPSASRWPPGARRRRPPTRPRASTVLDRPAGRVAHLGELRGAQTSR